MDCLPGLSSSIYPKQLIMRRQFSAFALYPAWSWDFVEMLPWHAFRENNNKVMRGLRHFETSLQTWLRRRLSLKDGEVICLIYAIPVDHLFVLYVGILPLWQKYNTVQWHCDLGRLGFKLITLQLWKCNETLTQVSIDRVLYHKIDFANKNLGALYMNSIGLQTYDFEVLSGVCYIHYRL